VFGSPTEKYSDDKEIFHYSYYDAYVLIKTNRGQPNNYDYLYSSHQPQLWKRLTGLGLNLLWSQPKLCSVCFWRYRESSGLVSH